jgi:hypothetical protein
MLQQRSERRGSKPLLAPALIVEQDSDTIIGAESIHSHRQVDANATLVRLARVARSNCLAC